MNFSTDLFIGGMKGSTCALQVDSDGTYFDVKEEFKYKFTYFVKNSQAEASSGLGPATKKTIWLSITPKEFMSANPDYELMSWERKQI